MLIMLLMRHRASIAGRPKTARVQRLGLVVAGMAREAAAAAAAAEEEEEEEEVAVTVV